MKKSPQRGPAKHGPSRAGQQHAKSETFRDNSRMASPARASRAASFSNQKLQPSPHELAPDASERGRGQSGPDPRPRVRGDHCAEQRTERGSPTRSRPERKETLGPSDNSAAVWAAALKAFGARRSGSATRSTSKSDLASHFTTHLDSPETSTDSPQLALLSSALGEQRDKSKAAWDTVLKLLADTTTAHMNAALAIEAIHRELDAVNNRLSQLSSGMAASAQMRTLPGAG